MSFFGKKIRLQRLLSGNGRLLSVAVDQAMARGIFEELMPIQRKVDEIASGGPDGITIHKGLVESCFAPFAGKTSLVLKCSTFSPWQPNYDAWVTSVLEGVRMGADAVSLGCIVGGDDQPEQIRNLGEFVAEANTFGMPVIAHIYPRGNKIPESEKMDWRHHAYAVRLGAELGVDIVKTHYTGDPQSFSKVIASTTCKVVVAGGDTGNDILSAFQMTKDVLDVGGAGITFGRFVWNNQNPTAVVRALSHIIHKDGSVQEAAQLYEDLTKTKIS
ncbi:class I fructose-bisphosphate aldolase [Paenibacillus xerothermodurans]|uniref:Fructose-bisphosphate aldolase n=1 Tax=Paenibacillus xerothermodurans TaxID=1977292 RepID=A0A2W1NYH8_PAEXE|nr:fructose-bisphosphate aldolase [Paenibacillus xerothermodurans]PZE22786.1 fructose-bisphosphate aldolase [Paenibacillus xerothermodurans]